MSLALLGRHMVLHTRASLQAAKQWHTGRLLGESPALSRTRSSDRGDLQRIR
jgi:hypothetical protein